MSKSPSTAVANVSDNAFLAGLNIGGNVEVTSVTQISRDVLSQKDNKPFAVRILSHIYKGEEIKRKRAGGIQMAPANLCHVLDMEDGTEKTLIANAVLQSELDRAFPDLGYVGKYFGIESTKGTTKDGGRSLRKYKIVTFTVKTDVGTLTDPATIPPPATDNDDDGEDTDAAAETVKAE